MIIIAKIFCIATLFVISVGLWLFLSYKYSRLDSPRYFFWIPLLSFVFVSTFLGVMDPKILDTETGKLFTLYLFVGMNIALIFALVIFRKTFKYKGRRGKL
jgi:hypothetical protein